MLTQKPVYCLEFYQWVLTCDKRPEYSCKKKIKKDRIWSGMVNFVKIMGSECNNISSGWFVLSNVYIMKPTFFTNTNTKGCNIIKKHMACTIL